MLCWSRAEYLNRRRVKWIVAAIAVTLVVLLALPVATWLQCRSLWLQDGAFVDAVYLVAGAKAQDRRIAAITPSLDCGLVLIGNDTSTGDWLESERRHLTMTGWAERKLANKEELSCNTEIVTGEFLGTDGEMEALALYLSDRSEIRTIALATSRFHVRRAVRRLRTYIENDMQILVVPAEHHWSDRAPWIVAIELGKMVRDGVGLSRALFVSREGWRRLKI